MAIQDTITKDSLLKALFRLIVESDIDQLDRKLNAEGLTVENVLKSLWNCTDPVPKRLYQTINRQCSKKLEKQTYAAAVRTFYKTMKENLWDDEFVNRIPRPPIVYREPLPENMGELLDQMPRRSEQSDNA